MPLPWEPVAPPPIVPKKKKVPSLYAPKPDTNQTIANHFGLPTGTLGAIPVPGALGGGATGQIAAAAGGGGVAPPSAPSADDFMNRIMADPLYSPASDAYQAALSQGFGNMVQDPFRQALIAYGGNLDMSKVPDNLKGDVQRIIDQQTTDAAAKNQTSTMALLGQALGRGQAALPYQLAAGNRGRSGAALVQGRKLDESYQLQSQQALQSLLGVLLQGEQNYGQYSDTALSNFNAAKEAIATRLAQNAEDPGNTDGQNSQPGDYNWPGTQPAPLPNNYPYLNPTAPNQVYSPVHTGSYTSYEPHATGQGYQGIIPPPPKKKGKK